MKILLKNLTNIYHEMTMNLTIVINLKKKTKNVKFVKRNFNNISIRKSIIERLTKNLYFNNLIYLCKFKNCLYISLALVLFKYKTM